MALRGWVAMAATVIGLGACADDPIVGTWQAEANSIFCAERVRFEVFDDLTGGGEACGCDFTFVVIDRGGGRYDFDVDFLDPQCLAQDDVFDCYLNEERAELDCDELGDFDKVR